MKEYTLEKIGEDLELRDTTGKKISFTDLLSKETNVYLLKGEMGAGKTTFVKELCKELKIEDTVNSPTFAIVNEYKGKNNTIYHFDCYRLKNIQEAIEIGFEEYINSENLCLIEWPEIVENLITVPFTTIFIEDIKGKRLIKVI
ncbi:MAG: tRNA (adenosine(37)-N6)-threonylcarbamoyltransferase complex ATPase subunit type 1 TsaE [Paludibacteraceae bacterium]|nr:tRNA (adenosine(37)-N6)-threonylcarbamoyltransferase complex ATPase subunit type 1 TsaE [Paludibacteraceae bacterium]